MRRRWRRLAAEEAAGGAGFGECRGPNVAPPFSRSAADPLPSFCSRSASATRSGRSPVLGRALPASSSPPRPPIRPGPYCGAPSSPPFPQSQPLTTTCRPQTPERGSGRSRSPPEPLAAGPGPALRRLLAAHSRLGPFQAQASPRRLIRAPRPGGSRFPPEPCPTPGLWAISPIIRSAPGSRGRVGPGGGGKGWAALGALQRCLHGGFVGKGSYVVLR